MGVALCPFDTQAKAIQADIVHVIRQFYPDIQIEFRDEGIWLSSQLHSAANLKRVYHAALLNERLVTDGRDARASVIDRLLQ